MPMALARSLAEGGDRPRRAPSRTPWTVDKASTSPASRRRPGHRNHFDCLAQSHTPREMRLPFCPPARLALCLRLVCSDGRSVGHLQATTHPFTLHIRSTIYAFCRSVGRPTIINHTRRRRARASYALSTRRFLLQTETADSETDRQHASYLRQRRTGRLTYTRSLPTDRTLDRHFLAARRLPAVPPLLQLSDTRFVSSS